MTRRIVTPRALPIGTAHGARYYPRGTVQVAQRVIGPTPIPQRVQMVKSSEFSGEVGPRDKIRYIVPSQIFPRLRMANTILGLTFMAPKGSRRRKAEQAAGVRMESRPRYTRVLRYPRPSREPGVYNGGRG